MHRVPLGRTQRRDLARSDYDNRNETLRLLGFKSSRAYLKSKLWAIVRERALQIHGRACRHCGKEATQVHHASYAREVMIGEDVQGLVPVCGACHQRASLTRLGTPARMIDGVRVRPLAETNAILAKPSLPKAKRGAGYWCACGRMRKKNKKHCHNCPILRFRQKRRREVHVGVLEAPAGTPRLAR